MALILVVEDNPINLELVRYLLQAHGHQVLEAVDGAQGLETARAARPDLVICDVQLPVLDGHGVALALRTDPALRHIPLLAVSASAMVGDRDRALAAGFDAHLAKPIDPERFVPWVARYLPPARNAHGTPSPAAATPGSAGAGTLVLDASLRSPRDGLVLLMVDDQPAHQEYKRELLEPAGYTVRCCGDGALAWQRLAEGDVQAVVSDVVMPGVDGWALLQRVRSEPRTARLPFVFLTSTARDSLSRARAMSMGADDYLVRPLEPLALLRALRRLLDSPGRG